MQASRSGPWSGAERPRVLHGDVVGEDGVATAPPLGSVQRPVYSADDQSDFGVLPM